MPGARQRVGEVFGQCEPVGLLALDLIVRGDRAKQDLRQEQREDHPEIFGGGAHRRGDPQQREWVRCRDRMGLSSTTVGDRVMPAQDRDPGNQEQHAEGRPHPQRRRRRVADQRFAGPVVGVGDFLAGHAGPVRRQRCAIGAEPLRGRGPRCPPEEGSQRAPVFGGADRVLLHRVLLAQLRGGWVVAEQAFVMRGDIGKCDHAVLGQRDRFGGGIKGVGPHHFLQPASQAGLLLGRQHGIGRHATVGARPDVEHASRLAMQPVRAPVRGDIRAVAPDRAQLHPAERLPDLTALLDIGAGVDDLAILRDHPFRHRRRGAEDLGSGPQQHPEREH